jgi:hypothetical protein
MQGKRKEISISRSRFYRKNDNAHVEQKGWQSDTEASTASSYTSRSSDD